MPSLSGPDRSKDTPAKVSSTPKGLDSTIPAQSYTFPGTVPPAPPVDGPWKAPLEPGETLQFCTENPPEIVARQMIQDQDRIRQLEDYADSFRLQLESAGLSFQAVKEQELDLRQINESLLASLRHAVARVEVANAEGDPILSAWLSDARAAVTKAQSKGAPDLFASMGLESVQFPSTSQSEA